MFGFFSGAEATATTPPIETYATRNDVDYVAFGKKSIEILLGRHTGSDKVTTWEVVDDSPTVPVWRGAVVGSDWSPFRVKTTIRTTKSAIEKALLDPEVLMELDDMTEQMKVIHQADTEGKLTLRHFTSKAVFPVASREFILITYSTIDADGRLIIASRSVDLGDIVPIEGTVRARNLITGYIIEEKTNSDGVTHCEVTLVAHADLSGYIPASVVNMLGTSATVKMLANLKTLLEK